MASMLGGDTVDVDKARIAGVVTKTRATPEP